MSSILLQGGYLMPMDAEPFVGDILIKDGKITEIGNNLSCDGAQVVNVTGAYVLPGLVDAHSHIGLMHSGSRQKDHNELISPVVPHMRAIDSINPLDIAFEEARAGGVTTSVTGPGSMNLIGGTFAAVKSYGNTVEKMLLRDAVAMKVALGENPKTYATDNAKYPRSRLGIAAQIREAFVEADNYKHQRARMAADEKLFVPRNLKNEALIPVLDREMPLKIHIHQNHDIMTAIRICNEFNVRFTLDHCTEGYLITDEIADAMKRNCEGVIVGPFRTYKGKPESNRKIDYLNPKALYEAGILFAIMSDFYETQPESLITHAALAAAEGLPATEALKAITINAAKITGIADRVGSLTVGKDADIAVYSAYPLDYQAKCLQTYINGELVYQRM